MWKASIDYVSEGTRDGYFFGSPLLECGDGSGGWSNFTPLSGLPIIDIETASDYLALTQSQFGPGSSAGLIVTDGSGAFPGTPIYSLVDWILADTGTYGLLTLLNSSPYETALGYIQLIDSLYSSGACPVLYPLPAVAGKARINAQPAYVNGGYARHDGVNFSSWFHNNPIVSGYIYWVPDEIQPLNLGSFSYPSDDSVLALEFPRWSAPPFQTRMPFQNWTRSIPGVKLPKK